MSSQNNEMVNRLAFVGNLPPDATAEEMKQLCSQVGEVILFRIVYDRETGKPKGYGFCEYRDPKLVEAAVDLLHGFEHRGMNLYVRRANQDKHSNNSFSMSSNQFDNSNNSKKSTPTKKKKKQASSKRKTVDEITRVVQSFSTSEKREILSQMKLLIEQNEKGAKEILLENPQLAQALLLIQMEFNLVKAQDINALTQIVSNIQPMKSKEKLNNNNNNNTNNNNDNNNNNNNTLPSKAKEEEQDIEMKEEINTNQNNSNQNINNNNNNSDVNENKLKGLSDQQQNVLGRVMKMSPQEIAKLPIHVQNQVRAVQAQLAKRKINT